MTDSAFRHSSHSTYVSYKNVVIVGASGGIGAAVLAQLLADPQVAKVFAFSRKPLNAETLTASAHINADKLRSAYIDLDDESSIEAMTDSLDGCLIDTVLICSGLLHAGDLKPEKSVRQATQNHLHQLFQINAIAPLLVAKQLIPHLRKNADVVVGVISARVGSISDNQLGGWYGYRASKSALHMFLKNLAIELKRKLPKAIVVSLHPGTVNTALSAPFQAKVPEGKLFSPAQSAGYLLKVVGDLTPEDSGKIFAWDGQEIQP